MYKERENLASAGQYWLGWGLDKARNLGPGRLSTSSLWVAEAQALGHPLWLSQAPEQVDISEMKLLGLESVLLWDADVASLLKFNFEQNCTPLTVLIFKHTLSIPLTQRRQSSIRKDKMPTRFCLWMVESRNAFFNVPSLSCFFKLLCNEHLSCYQRKTYQWTLCFEVEAENKMALNWRRMLSWGQQQLCCDKATWEDSAGMEDREAVCALIRSQPHWHVHSKNGGAGKHVLLDQ